MDAAYKGLQKKFKEDEDVIPQHRQFLDNGGFGVGTPAQRQKQAQKYRAFKANEAVFERRMGQLTAQYEDRWCIVVATVIKRRNRRWTFDTLVTGMGG